MRLLDTSTIELHEFHGRDIPRYAILSHTWGKEEVSFQDLPSFRLKGPSKSHKIVRCCELAASHQYQYVWIDTCCINKTSSAELSEAINLMYRWYRNSSICYAYLEDVSFESFDLMRDFESSRWFRRGWTLQELLAPPDVIFYDRRWTQIGDRSQLLDQISMITGIQQCYMNDHWNASMAARMSWAFRRGTTRLEDLAYCLMGIFDVNMPLLYGEGEKAFIRLQHEIVKNYDDESIFAWKDPTLRQSGMFATSPAAFADSGTIVSCKFDQIPRHDPPSVTSRGLAMEVVVKVPPLPVNFFLQMLNDQDWIQDYVPLQCAYSFDLTSAITLCLRRESADGFVRTSHIA